MMMGVSVELKEGVKKGGGGGGGFGPVGDNNGTERGAREG